MVLGKMKSAVFQSNKPTSILTGAGISVKGGLKFLILGDKCPYRAERFMPVAIAGHDTPIIRRIVWLEEDQHGVVACAD